MKLYAGFWRQLWAGSLDIILAMLTFSVLFIMVYALLAAIFPLTDYPLEMLTPWFKGLLMLYYFLYRTLFIASKFMATYGMRALNIVVTDLDGAQIAYGRAALRELLTYVSSFFFWLGYLIIPFTQRKQGFHDIVTDCLVLKKDPGLFQ